MVVKEVRGMYFNFRGFFRVFYLSFFGWRNIPAPLAFRRILFLLGFFIFFPISQIFNACCLLLDDILFPGYRKLELEKPVFITGNFRSGTTFMHRIMANDKDQFFCFLTWEIMFPAIIQKKVLAFVGRVDKLLGEILSKAVKGIESRLFRNFNKMHRVSLFIPEEDDKLLMHSFAHLDLIWFFPFFDEFTWLGQFDKNARPKDQKKVMNFYKNCIKRQAYLKGRSKRFLSKSPFATSRIATLYEHFPGCKIVYMVRNPLEVIPSAINMAHEIWRSTLKMERGYPLQHKIYDIIAHNYIYPLRRFELEPLDSYLLINYDDLLRQPSQVIQKACLHLGIEVTDRLLSVLKEEEEKAKNYKSGHVYSLDHMQISQEKIVSDLAKVFDRFGFNTSQ
jgi:hypothetical protein